MRGPRRRKSPSWSAGSPDDESRAFVRGFAAAVAEVAETFDQPTMARSLLDGAGLRPAHFWDANVDKPDLKVLERLFAPATRSRRVSGRAALAGAIVLSTGTTVPVDVRLAIPVLTREEERELESFSVKLHDLTPEGKDQSK